jgi:cupin 2 domain-containing protein
LPDELFETLVENQNIHIERIVSKGHATPGGQWYDQVRNEFVLLVKGAAKLEFEDGPVVSMGAGDWLEIPAGVRHRVAWTDSAGETVWLAVHYRNQ